MHDPAGTVEFCREILNDDGKILASIPNVMHISVMQQLLNGRFTYEDTGLLDRTHIHMFTYKEIVDLFQKNGFKMESVMSAKIPLSDEQEQLIQDLQALSRDVAPFMYETFQYRVVAGKCTEEACV